MERNPKAFPLAYPEDAGGGVNSGMTLRDYFAASAMRGMVSARAGGDMNMGTIEGIVGVAYTIADEMLSERGE